MALAGTCSLSAEKLAERVKHARGPADVEAALCGVHGSFHVVASVGGIVYARGSLSGARRLHTATVGDITVAADRARTLAWLTGAELDTTQLAARLVTPFLPYPLAGGAMWRGIRAVAPGEAMRLGPSGPRVTAPWWHAPEGELPLAEAASALRDALREAVCVRVRPGEVLGVDLSGGMDSTSVCFLAAEAGVRLITATLHWSAPDNEDPIYSGLAADRLPVIQRLVFPATELPAHFAGLHQRRDPGDEPSSALRDRAQQQYVSEQLRAHGAVRRLTGHGGDHVVQPPESYLHTLLRRSPRLGLRHAAGLRAKRRWPLRATASVLLDSRPYNAWLAGSAAHLRETSAPVGTLPHGWGPRPHLPAWADAQAVELISDLLRSAAGHVEPLAGDRTRHAWMELAQEAGRTAAHLTRESTAAGLVAHSPFCDDNVITACMAARPHEAAAPWTYKPLLAAAMDGLVPIRVLRRTTKDHCGPEWYAGLGLHLRDLANWAEDSRLVAVGLADRDQLRRALMSPGLLGADVGELEFTLGAEEWLRDLAAHPVPAYLDRDDARSRHSLSAPLPSDQGASHESTAS
ncbi:asparagine synthase-related protein [Streptomyces sp. NPDC053048]|uniref:asparagine synthase-related protein n=1 Tax=Streptomyces sp. NPDC053048 TaxID=3365694 RepID=UPI0037D86F3A